MMELHLGPGDVARVAVEQDDNGARLLLRMGNGRWRPLTPRKAREFAELLVKGADEVDAQRRPATDPFGAPAGSGERARIAAEKLPTVGQWPGTDAALRGDPDGSTV